jgi:amino acid transporter
MTTDSSTAGVNPPGLKRTLGLFALIIYGLVLIQPTAPMPLFGAAALEGKGHVVTAILIGMVGMLFTAISYGRMANVYPSAGSAYAYVSREIHPAMGYFVGWGIIFDYVLNPIICVLWIGEAAKHILPEIPLTHVEIPSTAYIVIFAMLFTGMNLRGIEASSRTNTLIATGLGAVIVLFLGAAIRYLWLQTPEGVAGWTRPFYDPQTFSRQTVSSGAAMAVLTYIGFDGISTLSEEAKNPRRNILLATVLVCVITGVLASVQVYAAQLVWPGTYFPDTDTAFCYVAGKAGAGRAFQGVEGAKINAMTEAHNKMEVPLKAAQDKLEADEAEKFTDAAEAQFHQKKIEEDKKTLQELKGREDAVDLAYKKAVDSAIASGGGMWLFQFINAALLVATIGSGAGAHLGAGRLLYSMGRDNAIPKKFFAAINPRTRIPSNNILLLGVIMLISALAINYIMTSKYAYDLGAQLLNFGALIAFMGVNVSALVHYYLRGERKTFWNFLAPALGFFVCAYLWWSLAWTAKICGATWLLTGGLYGAWRTNWFRKPIAFTALDDGTGAGSPKAP